MEPGAIQSAATGERQRDSYKLVIAEQQFPSRLRERMKRRRVSQKALADALGVSRSSVARWLGGSEPPTAQTCMDISEFLQTSLRYLLGMTDDPSVPVYANAIERELVRVFRTLDPKGQQSALELLRESAGLFRRSRGPASQAPDRS